MPQVFQVLRCYKCLVFQVHQTKKSNKFECKMCGEKQSIKRHYGLGNGQECRKHVQKLNGIQGKIDESQNSENDSTDDETENNSNVEPNVSTLQIKTSKWSEFIEKSVENTEFLNNGDKMYHNDTEVVFELPKKRRKILGKGYYRDQSMKISPEPMQSSEDNYTSSLPPKRAVPSSGSAPISNVSVKKAFTPPVKKERSPSADLDVSSHNSKWVSIGNESDDTFNSEQTSHENFLMQKNYESQKKFMPLSLNKNSKWAKFAEETDVYEEKESEEPKICKNSSQNDPHTLFSLCDNNDLDDYLTI